MGWGSPGLTSCSVHTTILVCVRTLAPLICFIFRVIRITSPFTRCVSQAFWGMALSGACTSTSQACGRSYVHSHVYFTMFVCVYVHVYAILTPYAPVRMRIPLFPHAIVPLLAQGLQRRRSIACGGHQSSSFFPRFALASRISHSRCTLAGDAACIV